MIASLSLLLLASLTGPIHLQLEVPGTPAGARLLRYLASLLDEGPHDEHGGAVESDAPAARQANPALQTVRWDLEKVRRDALGGESRVWRPMLKYLADRRDQWVYWHDICAAVNRTPSQMAGALGAAERRVGGSKPYEKRHDGTDYQFRMPAVVAEVIDDVLGE